MARKSIFALKQCFLSNNGIRRALSQDKNRQFKNPVEELQEYLEVPIFKEEGCPFKPSMDEMVLAQKVFRPTDVHKIKLLASAVNPKDFVRHELPEVTFIGRSNIGKSSLLRAIFSEASDVLVKVSRVPGHTKTINFYTVGNLMCLVDAPGYGHAQPTHFVSSVEAYLKTRKNLRRTFLLIDGKIGLQHWDEIAVDMLEEFKIPYCIIMTKIDKASLGIRLKNLMSLLQLHKSYMSNLCFPQPFLVSSVSGEGIAYLQAFIICLIGNAEIDERLQLKPVT